MTCRYPTKRSFHTREDARAGALHIKEYVERQGREYNALYPYRCPGAEHWHLSSARQGGKDCPSCGGRHPAWFDSIARTWVVYAHGRCATQAVST